MTIRLAAGRLLAILPDMEDEKVQNNYSNTRHPLRQNLLVGRQLRETLCIIIEPEEELEVFCGKLDVEQVIHKVADSAWLPNELVSEQVLVQHLIQMPPKSFCRDGFPTWWLNPRLQVFKLTVKVLPLMTRSKDKALGIPRMVESLLPEAPAPLRSERSSVSVEPVPADAGRR